MRYLFVRWIHDEDAEPVELYSELDEAGWEIRKVERWRDGQFGYAGPDGCQGSTRLGEVPVPEIVEIIADPQFDAKGIGRSVFEDVWDAARRVSVSR
jgi:hypothetical protein